MRIALFQVPYHLGREGAGVALAPAAYAAAGLAGRLEADGHDVAVLPVRRPRPFTAELDAVVDVNTALANAVEHAADEGRAPVIAGGNCNTAIGASTGLRRHACPDLGLVWLDAHGDLNTPTTSPSGFLDGMPLAMITGHACPGEVWGRLGGPPLDDDRAVHLGARDLDAGEEENVAAWGIRLLTSRELAGDAGRAAPVFDDLARRAHAVHLHVDIDVVDPERFPAVAYPAPDGLSPDDVLALAGALAARVPIAGLSVTSYDPSLPDPDERTLRGSMDLLASLSRLLTTTSRETQR